MNKSWLITTTPIPYALTFPTPVHPLTYNNGYITFVRQVGLQPPQSSDSGDATA